MGFMTHPSTSTDAPNVRMSQRFLDVVEWIGNKLPDPAFLFVFALFITWIVSACLAPMEFSEVDPRTKQPIQVVSQLTATSLVNFLANMVKTFVEFPPLGLVLVSMLGISRISRGHPLTDVCGERRIRGSGEGGVFGYSPPQLFTKRAALEPVTRRVVFAGRVLASAHHRPVASTVVAVRRDDGRFGHR